MSTTSTTTLEALDASPLVASHGTKLAVLNYDHLQRLLAAVPVEAREALADVTYTTLEVHEQPTERQERIARLETAFAASIRNAERLERLGGPRRTARAAEAREHARLWKIELDRLRAEEDAS